MLDKQSGVDTRASVGTSSRCVGVGWRSIAYEMPTPCRARCTLLISREAQPASCQQRGAVGVRVGIGALILVIRTQLGEQGKSPSGGSGPPEPPSLS